MKPTRPAATIPAALCLLALAACENPKPRTVAPDPMAQAPVAAVIPVVAGRTAAMRRHPEFPAAYLDHLGAAADPLKNWPKIAPIQVAANMAAQFDGFAYDGLAGAPAKGVELVLDGKAYAAQYGKPRSDVMAYTKNPALGNTGYVLVLPGDKISPGPHVLLLRIIAGDGESYYQWPPIPFTAQ